MTGPSNNHLSRIVAACDRYDLAEARRFLIQDESREDDGTGDEAFWILRYFDSPHLIGEGTPSEDLARTELRTNSDEIVRRYKLRRSSPSESAFSLISLEQQHFDLVDWGVRILRPHLQAVTRPTSIKHSSLTPEWPASAETSRERDKMLRRYAKIVRRDGTADVVTAVLCQIVAQHALRSRLDRSTIRDNLYDALEALMASQKSGDAVRSEQVVAWCRVLEKTPDIAGAPQAPAAFHAFAHETWDFYTLLLGLAPTVNLNDESSERSHYHCWSEEIAYLAFPTLNGRDWETAIRTRGAGPGLDYLSRPDVSALRWVKLPWTRPTYVSVGGTGGGT